MTALARLACWIEPDRSEVFTEAFEDRLLQILQDHGLERVPGGGLTSVGVWTCLLQAASTAAAERARQELVRDQTWQAAWTEAASRAGGWQYRLGIHRAKGPGRVTGIGQGRSKGGWYVLGSDDGLWSAEVVCLLEDRRGDIWFGTHAGGVARFDGRRLVTYSIEDGLGANSVECILQDRQGHLWFGTGSWAAPQTGGGVTRYDGEAFTTYTSADGLGSDYVMSMLEDRQGRLWFGTHGGGVTRYDGEAFTTYTSVDGLGSDYVMSMLEDRQGRLWLGTMSGGVTCYDGEAFTAYTSADGLGADRVPALCQAADGRLWLGTYSVPGTVTLGGLSCLDDGVIRTLTGADGAPEGAIGCLLEDRDGNLWIGSHNGVARYRDGRFKRYSVEDGLGSNWVGAAIEDRLGRLWLGTREGVSRYDGYRLSVFTTADGLPSDWLRGLAEDGEGRLWIGTYESGVARFDGESFETFSTADGLASEQIKGVYCDRRGQVWALGSEGVSRFDGCRFEAVLARAGCAFNTVAQSRDGSLWFGSTQGVWHYDQGTVRTFTREDGLIDDNVWAVVEDDDGDLWFGTLNGISRFDGRRFTGHYTSYDGLGCDQVTCGAKDEDGGLWFGTWGGGVSCFDGEGFGTLDVRDGLGGNTVWSIAVDANGHLLFGVWGSGVSRYDGRVFQNLTSKDGLPSEVVQHICPGRDGGLWVSTEGGLARYRRREVMPQVDIRAVVADREYEPLGPVEIPDTRGLVVLRFEGVSQTTPHARLKYVYRLVGAQGDWQVTRAEQVEFGGLKPGQYGFEVRAVDLDLNYSAIAKFAVKIVPDPHVEALTRALNTGEGEFIGTSAALRQVQLQLQEVAGTDLTVLIEGETGTGKGMAARFCHELSPRQGGPFIHINCSALPPTLIETELFGHERGAFTGAVERRLGKVEAAAGGTLFLDEIGDMSLDAQTKLLRLLEEGTFERVGGTQTLTSRVRVIAATNRDLGQMVQQKQFRDDLYFRLKVFPLTMPPLRTRRQDVPLLALHFMRRMAAHIDKAIERFSDEAMGQLQRYGWPGNVRELEHAVQRAVIVCRQGVIEAEDLSLEGASDAASREGPLVTLAEHERRYILEVLEQTNWVIKGRQGAAAVLGLHESTLRHRLRKLGIVRPT